MMPLTLLKLTYTTELSSVSHLIWTGECTTVFIAALGFYCEVAWMSFCCFGKTSNQMTTCEYPMLFHVTDSLILVWIWSKGSGIQILYKSTKNHVHYLLFSILNFTQHCCSSVEGRALASVCSFSGNTNEPSQMVTSTHTHTHNLLLMVGAISEADHMVGLPVSSEFRKGDEDYSSLSDKSWQKKRKRKLFLGPDVCA